MQENTNSAVEGFSNLEDKIDFLFESDKTFQDLCKDYILCVCNVLGMKTNLIKNSVYVDDYEHLQHHLEQDILQVITG